MITTIIAGIISRIVGERYPINEENISDYLPAYNAWAERNEEETFTAISEDNIPDMELSDLLKVFAAAIAEQTDCEYVSSDNKIYSAEEVAETLAEKANCFITYALAHRDESEVFDRLYKTFLKKAIQDGISAL